MKCPKSWKRSSRVAQAIAGVYTVLALSGAAIGDVKDQVEVDPHAGIVPTQVLPSGVRRVEQIVRSAISPQELQEMRAAGKNPTLDPATGEMISQSFADYLPTGWRMGASVDGVQRDSMGNLIVNTTLGQPAWAQKDVDALRAAIVRTRDQAVQLRAQGATMVEIENELGNYIGQAITRSINIDDIANLDNAGVITPGVGGAVVKYLDYFENARFSNKDLFHYDYTPSAYGTRVQNFVARHGGTMQQIMTLDGSFGSRGAGGCFSEGTLVRGITVLSGDTNIWIQDNTDDTSADIATGFPLFFFYNCNDRDNNDMVRVGSNGYLTFFQQGGDALDGSDFSNSPIPDATAGEPGGFAAPWWDDLIVRTAQGAADKVSYVTEGTAPNRVFTVQWASISSFGGPTSSYHWFQVKLYETSGVVDLLLDFDDGGADVNDDATIGMENYAGDAGDCGPNCTNTNATYGANSYRYSPFRPSGDFCDGYFVTNGTQLIGLDINSANASSDAACGAGANLRDTYFYYPATCTGTLVVSTCGSRDLGGLDTVLTRHTACPMTAANQVGCSDDAGGAGCSGLDSRLTVNVTAGTTYYFRVAPFANSTLRHGNGLFNFDVTFTPDAAPSNDSCNAPRWISCDQTVSGSTGCATADANAITCGTSIGAPGVWYRIVGTGQSMTATTCAAVFGYDTKLNIYSGSCGALVCVAGNDDSTCTVSGLLSTVSWTSVINEPYYILVQGFGGQQGDFDLTVSSAGPPTNDNCGSGLALSAPNGSTFATLTCATNGGSTSTCAGNGNRDVWFTYTSPANGSFRMSACLTRDNFGTDPVLSVHTGCAGNPGNQLQCNDDYGGAGCNSFDSGIATDVTAGQTIRIRVTHFGSAIGTGNVVLFYNLTPCDPIDFNHDGVFPDTGDIEEFLAVFGGAPCSNDPNCQNIDFNNDGVFPATDDLEAFLRVYSGGPC